MPRGDKGAYTDKQKRQAEHIEEGYEKKGVSKKAAESRAWATVNKESGGGKKSGSGKKKSSGGKKKRSSKKKSSK
jgi:plasmid stabilization system protein ParE